MRKPGIGYNVTGFATVCVQNGNENDRVEVESRPVIQSLAPLQLLSTLLPLLPDLSSPDLEHLAR